VRSAEGALTVPFDLIFGLFVGLLFALAARAQFQNGVSPWGRELMAVLSFVGIILWPVAIYFYVAHADWSWMYFVDSKRLPWVLAPLVLLGSLVTTLGGYLVGWVLLRGRNDRAVLATLAALFIFLLVFVTTFSARLFTQGTFGEYHAGHGLAAGEGQLGWALAVCSLGVAIALAVVASAMRDQGKRFRS
jgi:hypothetical protein